ncbi:MAG: ribonuclease HI [Candidatus Azotimanducaceae bacterium]|jgi:ribonuclease HI
MEKITVSTRSTARESSGPASIEIDILDGKGAVIFEVSESIGNATNEYAAYFAVVRALQVLDEQFGEKTTNIDVEVKMDSEIVMKQLTGERPIKEPGIVPLFIEVHNLRVVHFPNLTVTHST